MLFRHSLGMRLRAAYVSFRRGVQPYCAEQGLTSDQMVVLTVLAEEDGITQKQVADRSYSDEATITVMLRSMEKSGFLRRDSHQGDRRVRRVFLTGKGREIQAAVYESHLPVIKTLSEGFSAQERRIIAAWLDKVAGSETPAKKASTRGKAQR